MLARENAENMLRRAVRLPDTGLTLAEYASKTCSGSESAELASYTWDYLPSSLARGMILTRAPLDARIEATVCLTWTDPDSGVSGMCSTP